MELNLKIYILSDTGEKFFGIGVFWLLRAIHMEGSIRQAAADLGISYTKALRMLRVLEKHLGRPVLIRRKGGESREGAVVTPCGHYLLEKYELFQERVKSESEVAFSEFTRAIEAMPDEIGT